MKGTVRPMTPGQREQLAARIIPGDLTFDEAQAIIEAPKTSEFDTKVAAAFAAKRIIVPGHFPVWRTIKVGTFKTPAKLDAAIENADCRISDWARDLMTRPEFTLAGKQEDVELVKVTVGELGFAKATPLSKIRDRGVELGLELCQAEDGPQLR